MSQSLFPRLPQNAGTSSLLQFKAGKCKMELQANGKYKVSPDLRKGSISLVRTSDNVLHFRWLDRTNSNAVVDDYIIMPNETVFSKVNTGNDNDRVFILKWKQNNIGSTTNSSSRTTAPRYAMFWMQQKQTNEDTDNVKKVNEYLNQSVPAPATNPQTQWMQMMGLAPPTAPTPNVATQQTTNNNNTSNNTSNNNNNVDAILGSMDFGSLLASANSNNTTTSSSNNPTSGNTVPPPAPTIPQGQTTQRTSLLDLLKSDVILSSGIFNDADIRKRLLELLPTESTNSVTNENEEVALLQENVHSPQFQQAIDVLSEALSDPANYQSILSSFNIDPNPGMPKLMMGDPIGAFVDCITAEATKRKAKRDEENNNNSLPSPP
eukprot:TRINITY_DN66122_c18_g1_i1.p1 TRINITY_DN66122_c18_g1~~TRINITY_DN66122_c18_g1_i1.p1  ORF type:complete len:378 (+),score=51.38 TRINITY_DN66122_c18_g1_i1:53-1186(+)